MEECAMMPLEPKSEGAVRKSGRRFLPPGLLDGAESCFNAPVQRVGDET